MVATVAASAGEGVGDGGQREDNPPSTRTPSTSTQTSRLREAEPLAQEGPALGCERGLSGSGSQRGPNGTLRFATVPSPAAALDRLAASMRCSDLGSGGPASLSPGDWTCHGGAAGTLLRLEPPGPFPKSPGRLGLWSPRLDLPGILCPSWLPSQLCPRLRGKVRTHHWSRRQGIIEHVQKQTRPSAEDRRTSDLL